MTTRFKRSLNAAKQPYYTPPVCSSPILQNKDFTHFLLSSNLPHPLPPPQSCLPLPLLPRSLPVLLSSPSLYSTDVPNSFLSLEAFEIPLPSHWNAHTLIFIRLVSSAFLSAVSVQTSSSQSLSL